MSALRGWAGGSTTWNGVGTQSLKNGITNPGWSGQKESECLRNFVMSAVDGAQVHAC